jgi:hypothetical protein
MEWPTDAELRSAERHNARSAISRLSPVSTVRRWITPDRTIEREFAKPMGCDLPAQGSLLHRYQRN